MAILSSISHRCNCCNLLKISSLVSISSIWFDDLQMKHPNPPGSVITQGMIRPNLSSWSEFMNETELIFPSFNQQVFGSVLHNGIVAESLLGVMRQTSENIEPIDLATGTDPMLIKSRAFKTGAEIGLGLTAPLVFDCRPSLVHAVGYARSVFLPKMKNISAKNEAAERHLRGNWLVAQGQRGLDLFSEVDNSLDNLVDEHVPEVSARLYAKVGAGVLMSLVWSGFHNAEHFEMLRLDKNAAAGKHDLDAELANFLLTH